MFQPLNTLEEKNLSRFTKYKNCLSKCKNGNTIQAIVQHCPMIYCEMKFAGLKTNHEPNISCEIFKENNLPGVIDENQLIPTGFEWYNECINDRSNQTNLSGNPLSLETWTNLFHRVRIKINLGITEKHGIDYTSSDYERNQNIGNEKKFILHIADAMIHYYSLMNNNLDTLTVSIVNDHFKGQWNVDNTSTFFTNSFSTAERYFIIQNVDFLFHCYGYWFNHSKLPIRLKINNRQAFKRSIIVTDDIFFERQQSVKLAELSLFEDECFDEEHKKYFMLY